MPQLKSRPQSSPGSAPSVSVCPIATEGCALRVNHNEVSQYGPDMEIRSADGFIFQLHSVVLGVATSAFPGLDKEGEVVQLTEPANVLEILFAFLYPKAHPDLYGESFEMLMAVAEAAGKYEVHSAADVCNERLLYVFLHSSSPLFLSITYLRIIGSFYLCADWTFLTMQSSTIVPDSLVLLFLISLEALLSQFWRDYLRLMWFPGYVGKNKRYERLIVNLSDQVRYHAAWTSLFKEITHYVNEIPRNFGNNCHSNELGSICNTCLASLHALTGKLEEIDTLPILSKTLLSPDTSFPSSILNCCEDRCCPFVESVTYLWQDKIREIPSFASLLGLKE